MMAAIPMYRSYAGGMEGGPNNPLGPRALYLYRNGRDTFFRLHGTTEPETIGSAVSSGCIRLFNQDIIDLYNRVPVGTQVTVV
jgi:lipoprotein-anchoring transpeptidase ErfK/SrfK